MRSLIAFVGSFFIDFNPLDSEYAYPKKPCKSGKNKKSIDRMADA